MPGITDWLNSVGDRRREASEEAAALILSHYRQKWPNLRPIELNRLAALLNVKLREVPELEGEARLAPTPGGFLLLFSRGARQRNYARFRTSISHELAHTLFYEQLGPGEIPRRLLAPSEKEEQFCFDVARRILAPRWMLANLGLLTEGDAGVIFKALTRMLGLSWSVAARLIVEDYALVLAVAGRWRKTGKRWEPVVGEFFFTPELSEESFVGLRQAVRAWLEGKETVGLDCKIAARLGASGKSAFVIAQVPSEHPQEALADVEGFWQANLNRWRGSIPTEADKSTDSSTDQGTLRYGSP
ncbi:MAG: hypothetical protein WC985_00300 [Thermoplasmata archaeon]